MLFTLFRMITKQHHRIISIAVIAVVITAVILMPHFQEIPSELDTPKINRLAPPRIPRILHQTWVSENIPEEIRGEWIESWQEQNPDWDYWFWTDADIRCFLSREYPEFLQHFDAYPAGIFRSDAMRYFVLYHFGGVYADLDTECLKPMDPWLMEHSCIITEDHPYHSFLFFAMTHQELTNALMMCRRQHPFMKSIISELPQRAHLLSVLHATGPTVVTDVYLKYPFKIDDLNWRQANTTDYVAVEKYGYFMPTFDPALDAYLKNLCSEQSYPLIQPQQQNMCQRFRSENFENKPFNSSYVNHHWVHTNVSDKWGKMKTYPLSNYAKNITSYQSLYGHCNDVIKINILNM